MSVTVDSEEVTVIVNNQTADITLNPQQQTLQLSPRQEEIVLSPQEATIVVEEQAHIVVANERSVDVVTISVGSGGSGASTTNDYTAGNNLSALRVVRSNSSGEAIYADKDSLTDADALLGITTNAATSGNSVTVQSAGKLEDAGWSWTPGSRLFLQSNGNVSHTVPSTGFIVSVGHAVTATVILIRLREPIFI